MTKNFQFWDPIRQPLWQSLDEFQRASASCSCQARLELPLSTPLTAGFGAVLTIPQLRLLARECYPYETLILFAGTTGLRWGEIAALQCRDVSVLNKTVNVSKAVSDGLSGEKIISTTKTHQNRSVPVPKDLIPGIEFLIANRSAEAILFSLDGEKLLDYNNFMNRVFRPAVKRCGFEGIGFHNLRHTTASLLISQGTPITTVAGILGHASTQMTLDTYGHLYEDDASKYIDRLGEHLFNSGTDKERTATISVAQ